jgi:hypothetical protein
MRHKYILMYDIDREAYCIVKRHQVGGGFYSLT